MGIAKNQPWGRAQDLPAGAPTAHTNTELREYVETVLSKSETVRSTNEPPTICVAGGDIWAGIGAPTNTAMRLADGTAHGALIDVIQVQADTVQHWCCAHVLARRTRFSNRWLGNWFSSWSGSGSRWSGNWSGSEFGRWSGNWSGKVVAVMNAEWMGPWRVAPAAHPGDGFLHVVEATGRFGIGQRRLARRRLRTGDHLPHPGLRSRRVTEASFEFEQPMSLWLDGDHIGRVRSLSTTVVPAAVRIVF